MGNVGSNSNGPKEDTEVFDTVLGDPGCLERGLQKENSENLHSLVTLVDGNVSEGEQRLSAISSILATSACTLANGGLSSTSMVGNLIVNMAQMIE